MTGGAGGGTDAARHVGLDRRLRRHVLRNRAKLRAGRGRLGSRFRHRVVPRFPRLICELEWLFSSTEGSVLGFYLEHDSEHDVLWQRSIYSNGLAPPWSAVATMEKVGATRAECAALLLRHYLQHLCDVEGWGRFYGIADAGLLSVCDLRLMAEAVWTEGDRP